MTACPVLTTERLVLRPFRDEDLGPFTEVLRAEPVRASLHLPDDVGPGRAFTEMAAWVGQWQLRGTGHWALEERVTGALVGRAGLHRPGWEDWPGVEVGWTLHPRHWGKGYATEAGARAVAWAFEHLGLSEVFSVILPTNRRSQAVARRLGFSLLEERTLSFFPTRPHGIWHLPATAWKARA
ncbi:MAG: GNAT family N-acetyltransferase [Acidimicrobiia bacterium]